ncbi:M24 family metallopeptidase [Paenibacillus thalictri]|uniref:Aminopeptidase P family protein n=1 Tax=Paenibacillus thalictri TaxID=2527873 RepID=A0A4Q9DW89_9BACL|nr:Xaa-Pro peptidase family protein [Paenibacillus thalictri]TBL80595.1 aminopeptidase P family protein [Paenibacillus thalictri]
MIDYSERIARLQQKMREKQTGGFLVAQNVDIYYLCGSMQTGYLFVPVEGDPVFYVRRSVVRAEEEAQVEVEPIGSFRSWGERLKARFPQVFGGGQQKQPVVATEYDVLPVQQFQRLQTMLPGVQWADGSAMIRETRMIKSAYELDRIRAAARLIDEALEHALGLLRPGMAEFELMSEIEYYIRRRGHLGLMRMRGYNQETITGMVGGGAAAAMPTYFDGPAGGQGLSPASPQSAGRRKFERDEPILLDIGCCIDGYVIDQTRTAVIGELPGDLAEAYAVSEQIIRSTEQLLKPGTISEHLYFNSLDLAEKAGLALHFMGYANDQVKFLGHGIGLEIDELPVLAKGFTYPLQPGMVIAVEPKFTFPQRGVVGIENSYAITPDGFEKLSVSREGVLRV